MVGPADATPVYEAQKRHAIKTRHGRSLILQAPAELKAVADFLRGKNGPKVRRGVLNGKRVDYFKGKTALRTLLGPAYQKLKKVPAVKDEAEASALMAKSLPHAFFLRVDRPDPPSPPPSGTPKTLLLAPQQSFDPLAYYAWFYDGSPLTTILGGVAMVVILLSGVMFPLWPVQLRVGVWYLSIAALCLVGAFIGLAIVRLVVWCVTVVGAKKAIWIFPNLFEDVGFVDSFIPTWAYDEPKKKKRRVAGKDKDGKKKSKAVDGEGSGDGPGGAARAGADSVGSSSALDTVNGNPAHRRQTAAASIEEIEDDEA